MTAMLTDARNMIDPNDGLKEVSLVKFLDPSEFFFDILPEDVELEIEEENILKNEELLNEYFRNRTRETIEGREFVVGETVAACLNSTWRPAICTGLNIVSSSVVYEVLLMDCGQIIDVDMMHFRPFPFALQMTSRFNSFVLLDILPMGMRARPVKFGWQADADEDVRLLFQLASRAFVEITACYPLAGYNRLFGNVYLQISTKIIDLKKHLLDNEWAFENPVMFERIYQLTEDHFFTGKREHPYEMTNPDSSQCDLQVFSSLQPEEITDETLDNHLPDCWKIGGTDPLSQIERENFRRKIMGEARIGFGVAVQGYKRVQAEEKLSRKIRQCSVKEEDASEDLRMHSTPQEGGHHSFESGWSNSSFFRESQSDRKQSKESEPDDAGDFSESDHSSRNNTCANEQNHAEETWPQHNKLHRQFGGENGRFKHTVNRVIFQSPSENSNSKINIVRSPITDEMRKQLVCLLKDTSGTENRELSESGPNELTWKQEDHDLVVPSSVQHESSSSSTDSECIRKKEEISPKSIQVDIPDQTKQKIFALFKT